MLNYSALGFINVTLILFTAGTALAEDDRPLPDCGTNALFFVCKDHEPNIDLETISGALPPQKSEGYSMAELVNAANRLGVPLEGRHLGLEDFPLSRPAIAYLRLTSEGHYVALRPVGHRGNLVQIFDPPNSPRIIEYKELITANTWTGRCLIQRRPQWLAWGFEIGVLIFVFAMVYWFGHAQELVVACRETLKRSLRRSFPADQSPG